jgi:transposase
MTYFIKDTFKVKGDFNFSPELKNVSISFVSKFTKKRNIRPHKVRYYLFSKDPNYDEKVLRIARIYKEISDEIEYKEGKYVTFSVDEKPGIQVLQNIHPEIMPLERRNTCLLRDPEYKRAGTRNLISGVDLSNRTIVGKVYDRNRSQEFVNFLSNLNNIIDSSKVIRIVLDNLRTHSSKETTKFLNLTKVTTGKYINNPRFELVFIPTHCSWLNPIEAVFSSISRGYLRNGRFESIEKLDATLLGAIDDINKRNKSNWQQDHDGPANPLNWRKFLDNFFQKNRL